MTGSTCKVALKVCPHCDSDEIVYKDREKRLVKCLNCGKQGELKTVWRIRRVFKGGGHEWRDVPEAERAFAFKKGKTEIKLPDLSEMIKEISI